MDYTDHELKRIYDESKKGALSFNELKDIAKELKLICEIMEFDSFALDDVINTLLYFKKLNLIDKINIDSLNLLKQIVFGNKNAIFKDDSLLFLDKYLKNLLLPYNYNHCNHDYDIEYFLGEMDIFINLIRSNCTIEDLIVLKKYNNDLFEIYGRYYKIIEELEISNIYILGGLNDKLTLTSTLTHLSSILYLSLDIFDNQYDLLNKTWEYIMENIFDYLYTCEQNGLYQDLNPNENEILKEYELCFKLLKQTYNPPIKIKRS